MKNNASSLTHKQMGRVKKIFLEVLKSGVIDRNSADMILSQDDILAQELSQVLQKLGKTILELPESFPTEIDYRVTLEELATRENINLVSALPKIELPSSNEMLKVEHYLVYLPTTIFSARDILEIFRHSSYCLADIFELLHFAPHIKKLSPYVSIFALDSIQEIENLIYVPCLERGADQMYFKLVHFNLYTGGYILVRKKT